MKTRTYQELRRLETFEERYDYLELRGVVGESTFGFDRWVNQKFYTSSEWRWVRQRVIARDHGCDLGVAGYEIESSLLIHHINPLTPNDIQDGAEWILDPEFLITTTKRTHNAIHYGDRSLLPQPVVERVRGDTRLW
jgi:hypothetical protein